MKNEPKPDVEMQIGNKFPGEISGEEARRLGINFNLSPEARRDIAAISATIAISALVARFILVD